MYAVDSPNNSKAVIVLVAMETEFRQPHGSLKVMLLITLL